MPPPSCSRRAFLGAATAAALAPARAAPARDLRVALVSAASYGYRGAPRTQGSNHGTAFASCLNGFDPAKRAGFTGTFVAAKRRLEGVRVVKVWDPLRDAAARLADVCGIPEVAASPEACAEGVDAVLVVDDGSGEHWRHALPALRRGVPTFCDKPLAMTGRDARAVVAAARAGGAPFLSASSLRFVPDVVKLAGEVKSLGPVNLATSTCGNELVYYGIHALELAYAVLGGGAVSCHNVGQPGRNLARIRFRDGRDLMLIVGEREWMRAGYQLCLYGSKGWRTLTPDLSDLYFHLLTRFFAMLRDGVPAVPLDEQVEVIAALDAAKRSLAEKREVTLAEVLA